MAGKHVSEWDGAKRIQGRTSHGISLCLYNRKLFSVYKGWNNHTIWYNSFDGSEWDRERRVPGATSHAVSTAVFNGRLYIAYKAADSDTLLLGYYDGSNWSRAEQIPGAPHDTVALAVYGHELYVAYNQSDNSIWINRYSGSDWGTPERLIGRTNRGPALQVFDDGLHIAYKAWNNTRVWVNRYNGTEWDGQWCMNSQTNATPSLAAYRGYLFLCHKGWNSNAIKVNTMRWVRWEGEVRVSGSSYGTPTVCSFEKKLYMAYRDRNSRIHIDTFNGLSWDGERKAKGNTKFSPSAVVYKGWIYASQGRNDNRIGLVRSKNGRRWNYRGLIQGRSGDTAALVNWHGKLCVIYKAWNNEGLWFNNFDGEKWIDEVPIQGRTSHAPAAISHHRKLFVVYKGRNDHSLWMNYCKLDENNSEHWYGERLLDGFRTDHTPVLLSFKGKLYIAYKHPNSTRASYRCGYWNKDIDGFEWEPEKTFPGNMDDIPALASFGDRLYLLYKSSRCHDIYFNTYDKRLGWLGAYNITNDGGLTDSAPALVCKDGRVYAIYKGWDGTKMWSNRYRILQGWQPEDLPEFNPSKPLDANKKKPKCLYGEKLNHCMETNHFQVFWNESEPDEAVSPEDARLVADSLECSWELFTNSELAEGHAFGIDLDTPQYSNLHDRQKMPVWINGVTGGNGFCGGYYLQISARGGITGCAVAEYRPEDNFTGDNGIFWGPHGYAGGTAPHELGHAMNKSYSYHFNSGGSGLWWINEGIPDIYRSILDPYYPGTRDSAAAHNESKSPKKLLGHLELYNGSLLKTNDDGRIFWFYLIRAYSAIHDGTRLDDPGWGYYRWRDIPLDFRESFKIVAVSSGLNRVRKLPGRDIMKAIQDKFKLCFPKGQNTAECGAGSGPTPAEPTDPEGDSPLICAPNSSELYKLLPLAMEKIDEALEGYWTHEENPPMMYRSFREFLVQNFVAPNFNHKSESKKVGTRYRIKTLGAHYHMLTDDTSFSMGLTATVTIAPDTGFLNGNWAVAVFDLDTSANTMQPVHNWQLGSGIETMSIDTGRFNNPVVIIAGLYLGFTYTGKKLSSNLGYYNLTVTFA